MITLAQNPSNAPTRIAIVTDGDFTLWPMYVPTLFFDKNLDRLKQHYPDIKTGRDYWGLVVNPDRDKFAKFSGKENYADKQLSGQVINHYIMEMLTDSFAGKLPLMNDHSLYEVGKENIQPYKGIKTLISNLNHDLKESGKNVEIGFYVVSGGIRPTIYSVKEELNITEVFANELHQRPIKEVLIKMPYLKNRFENLQKEEIESLIYGQIKEEYEMKNKKKSLTTLEKVEHIPISFWPIYIVELETKIPALATISKGGADPNSLQKKRFIGYDHIIYISDGDTPAFSFLNDKQGMSIGIREPKFDNEKTIHAGDLESRTTKIHAPDYSRGSELYNTIFSTAFFFAQDNLSPLGKIVRENYAAYLNSQGFNAETRKPLKLEKQQKLGDLLKSLSVHHRKYGDKDSLLDIIDVALTILEEKKISPEEVVNKIREAGKTFGTYKDAIIIEKITKKE